LLKKIVTYTVDELSIKNFYEFRVPLTSIVGDGISARLGDYLVDLKMCNLLIITDATIVNLGFIKPLRSLDRCSIQYHIFDQITPDPIDEQVRAGIQVFKDCACDEVLTFGGGSVIDAGKAIAVFSTNSFDPSVVITENVQLASRPPLVALPTTAGTGSEVTMVSVITDSQNHRKLPHTHPLFIADVALIDPRLTLGIPPFTTAVTGIDVLTHAIESFLARGVCTLGQSLSYSAIQLDSGFLRRAVGDGNNLEARHKLATVSHMASMSFSNAGLGLCHAMAHQLGAQYNLQHGVANALLLPQVMRVYMLVREERFVQISRAFS